ncbi:MAG TPA: HD domain-containing protein [Candidatus Saccharimonadales bacterium]|nr:HD domain-containing protein [Candidatus Saccharimonadales bacterium]
MTKEVYVGPEAMPLSSLHIREVEEIDGPGALLDRFYLEVDRLAFADPDAKRDIDDAAQQAMAAHDGILRDGQPYFSHVLRMSLRLICHLEITDRDMIIAALFHDTVEDAPHRLLGIPHDEVGPGSRPAFRAPALAYLKARFGSGVAGLVGAVTNPQFSDKDKDGEYQEHVRRLLASQIVVSTSNGPKILRPGLLKLADFIDNSSGLMWATDTGKKEHLPHKYLPLFDDMRTFTQSGVLSERALSYVLMQLDRAERRCRALAMPQQQLGEIALAPDLI